MDYIFIQSTSRGPESIGARMKFSQREHDKERAKADCIKSGTPTLGVDHRNHYKPNPYADNTGRKTLAEATEDTNKAFNLYECNFCKCLTNAKQRACCEAGKQADKEKE